MKQIITLLGLAVLLFSCANEADPAAEKSEFVRIYDNTRFNASYYPIDVTQTSDGGYLILGGRTLKANEFTSDFPGVYLMKVDEFGNFVSDIELDQELVSPIGPILEVNGKYFFFCMKELTAQLIEIDLSLAIKNTMAVGGPYPLAAGVDNGNFLLLNYDFVNKQSVISIIGSNGNTQKSKGFTIGPNNDVNEAINDHLLRTGKQIPFQVGRSGNGQYYFNGFYNYTLSMVFTDLNETAPSGVANGQQEKGGFSRLLSLEGNSYAAARFNFGDNYFLPLVTINPSAVSSVDMLGGNNFPELIDDAPVKIIKTIVSGKEVLIYASDTRSQQIALFFYSKTTGEFIGSHYLGFSNPFEVTNLVSTTDNGLMVCATTYVAGRFPRICLFKLSMKTLNESLN
ncbi:hypothetical protein BH09BAC3_BH09BAC3_23280 [soil metagenome]